MNCFFFVPEVKNGTVYARKDRDEAHFKEKKISKSILQQPMFRLIFISFGQTNKKP